ncbi:MAG TPA: sulfotransferase [Roseiflexaceae bacterium]|nr:sulfotransferase [Roseiflexaceae bacterium]
MPKSTSPEVTNPGLATLVYDRLRMAKRYVTSYYLSRKHRALFDAVRVHCLFVGHARSGGSIVGALLDAHPHVVLADELDVLQHVAAGFSRDQIYQLIVARAARQAHKGRTKGGRDGKVYSYHVPGQWQGRFERLQVIGGSKAGISTQRLAQRPELLQRLRDTVRGAEVRVVQVIRNPYDTISTMHIRAGRPLEAGIERYFANCDTIARIQQRLGADMLSVKHEALVEWPHEQLGALCRFLGVEALQDYLDACAGILYASPATSRHKVPWSQQLIDAVQRRVERYDFLHGYAYDA